MIICGLRAKTKVLFFPAQTQSPTIHHRPDRSASGSWPKFDSDALKREKYCPLIPELVQRGHDSCSVWEMGGVSLRTLHWRA